MNKDDPTIQRIRNVRHEVSETNQHDLRKLVGYYIGPQKKYQGKAQPTEDVHPVQ